LQAHHVSYYECVKCCNRYAEVSQYTNYATGGFSGATGHFTQVVWKGEQEEFKRMQQACLLNTS